MKKNTWFRTLIKVWIAVVSLLSFMFGWIVLGHSGKPVSASASDQLPAQVQPLPTLEPLPTFDPNSGLQSLPQQQQNFSFFPSFRSRGS
jgi:hypothetical protein